MLLSLSIRNFALIEKLSIEFSSGFSVITGETGAGKSILLGALGHVLGKRADLSSLKNKEEKCVIEAQFDLSKYDLKPFFQANDLDYEETTILRREILPSGKSRAFINDSPAGLQELQELGVYLIDIHSQHQTRELSESSYQFGVLDALAQHHSVLTAYTVQLKKLKKDKSGLESLRAELAGIKKEQDYNAFLLQELQSAGLTATLQDELEMQFEQLNNVETIKESLSRALALSNDEQFGLQKSIREVKLALQKIIPFSEDFSSLAERIESIDIELDDISTTMENALEKQVDDPKQLELISQKLQLIYALQKKHQVATVPGLMEIQEELSQKILSAETLEENIAKLEKEVQSTTLTVDTLAAELHEKRKLAIPDLSGQLSKLLSPLGMPDARFDIKLEAGPHYYDNGKDQIQFLFSANKGGQFGILGKTASGGELSRIMLAIKAILAGYSKLPTIIFDEIDTGVSGEIANKMGDIMRQMSHTMQLFAITHLPQIASKGTQHFKVYKSVVGDQTISELKQLSGEERVLEIAEMLSGKDIGDSAINHARALLK